MPHFPNSRNNPTSGGWTTNTGWVRGRQRRWSLSVVVVVVVVLGATSVVTIGALDTTNAGPQHRGATSTLRWVTPHDESNAPTVLIPGGASQGSGNFNAISCPTSTHCVAVGADGALDGVTAISSNGGGSWTQGTTDADEPTLNAVDCANATACVAVGQGAAVWSSNGGSTWTSVSIPTNNTTLLGVSCPSATLCVSAGVSPGDAGPYGGELLTSSNGGKTWKASTIPPAAGAIGSVDCPTTTFCVAVGASVLVSVDGGTTWSERAVKGGTGVLRSVSCGSATTCIAVGANPEGQQNSTAGAFEVVTTNGGTSWNSQVLPIGSSSVDVVACFSDLDCAVSGPDLNRGGAPFYSTSNSGASWATTGSLPSSISAVSGLSCRSAGNCVFIGQSGHSPVSITTLNGTASTAVGVAPMVRAQRVRSS